MNQQAGRMALVLAVLGAILVVVLAYFVAIRPELDAASFADEQRQSTEQDNEVLRATIDTLKAQASNVDQWQSDIDLVATQIPRLPQTDGLHAVIIQAGAASGATNVELRVDDISLITLDPSAAQAAAPPPTQGEAAGGLEDGGTGESGTPAEGEEDAGTQEPAVPSTSDVPTSVAAVDGLVSVQFTITLEGKPDAVTRYLNALYAQQNRYITLGGLSITRSEGSPETPGRPALETGDWNAVITGMAFSLIDPENPIEIDETGGTVTPFGGQIRNPLAPVF